MPRIPSILHFVFGFREQNEPFHVLHYVAIESARRLLRPEKIFVHLHRLPFGVFWDEIRPHVTLNYVDPADEVNRADYDQTVVPEKYRYAHHADVVRLDALIKHGGVYADIDTVFIRPLPASLYEEKFVIGREVDVPDPNSGQMRPSLCNALMMSAPNSQFVKEWRDRLADELDGSWSNHSGFLAYALSQEMPNEVRIEPKDSFLPLNYDAETLDEFLQGGELDCQDSYSIHLWAHLWWERNRVDFSRRHAGDFTLDQLRNAPTRFAKLVAPYLPKLDLTDLRDPMP